MVISTRHRRLPKGGIKIKIEMTKTYQGEKLKLIVESEGYPVEGYFVREYSSIDGNNKWNCDSIEEILPDIKNSILNFKNKVEEHLNKKNNLNASLTRLAVEEEFDLQINR